MRLSLCFEDCTQNNVCVRDWFVFIGILTTRRLSVIWPSLNSPPPPRRTHRGPRVTSPNQTIVETTTRRHNHRHNTRHSESDAIIRWAHSAENIQCILYTTDPCRVFNYTILRVQFNSRLTYLNYPCLDKHQHATL